MLHIPVLKLYVENKQWQHSDLKEKKENLSLVTSVILLDPLEFLFVFKT